MVTYNLFVVIHFCMKETILKINLNHFDEDGPFVMAVTYSFLSD